MSEPEKHLPMSTSLVIDWGNSQAKVFVFEGDELTFRRVYTHEAVSAPGFLGRLREEFPGIEGCILSSVVRHPEAFEREVLGFGRGIVLSPTTPTPLANLYESPETLGRDRLAAAVGAWALFPGQDLLVFDAGTALTLELVDAGGRYLGGNISPGLSMRYRALGEFTQRLPTLSAQAETPDWGRDTRSAIVAGVQQGIVLEVQGQIDHWRGRWPDLKVVLTGGDTHFFEERLKSSIFARPNLVAIGLKAILDHNSPGRKWACPQ